ncbi:helix-turn-helix domain-containing protein [Granulosicoccus sp. 3-233]|uniref:helix-turn-helix domain-containing protein n=1 Tax=Granulosicoccus sp. 3-233 TaxID=3417969 RepID=UPI003D33148E
MKQSGRLVDALKRELKRRSIAYKEIATRLNLSESAVKQMFANGNFTLKRLDELCEILELDFSELANLARQGREVLEQLTIEQEERLVGDPQLLLVAYCVVNHWRFEQILDKYNITEAECIQRLAELDRMRVAELLPGNRIRPLISPNFHWQPDGPIERYFRHQVQGEFLDGDFNGKTAELVARSGDISHHTFNLLVQRLQAAGTLFDDLANDDRKLDTDLKHGTTMLLAIRHWQFAAFTHQERQRT